MLLITITALLVIIFSAIAIKGPIISMQLCGTLTFFCWVAAYLNSLNEPELTDLALSEYKNATNMTDQFSALAAICQNSGDARSRALSDFYEQWKDETLVSHIFVYFKNWLASIMYFSSPYKVITMLKAIST